MKKPHLLLIGLIMVTVSCQPAPTPISTPIPPTLTEIPPTSTPIPPTPTEIPPTPTEISPTPTSVPPTVPNYEIVRDIPYQQNGSGYASSRDKLDLYLPRDRENFPVLVWFHGGDLKYENKSETYATKVAKRLASEGIGVVLPNYGLNPQVKYPGYIEDAAGATAWVYHNIATYQGNPKQLFVGGHSSGAYLAAMIAMDERYLKPYQISSQQIAGVILMSGEMYGDSTVWEERGIIKGIDETKIDETTPMFYVQRNVPPFLNMCAEGDMSFPDICKENQKFIEALRATGHKNVTFEKIPGRDHFSIADLESPPDNPVVKLVLTFIQKAMSGK